MKERVLDANVILRFLLNDHPDQSPRCRELFRRLRDGEEAVALPEVVISDVVWTLGSFYRWPPDRIYAFVEALVTIDAVRMRRKEVVLLALRLFAERNVDFSDALIAAEMLHSGQGEIYSYDRDFERIAGIRRVEP